jgi:hypothetical protein
MVNLGLINAVANRSIYTDSLSNRFAVAIHSCVEYRTRLHCRLQMVELVREKFSARSGK